MSKRTIAVRWSSVIVASAADSARVRSDEHRRPLRVGLGAGRRLPALVVELGIGLDGPALAGALRVHRGVDADPVQPRLDAPATERAQVAERGEERLLDGSRTPGRGRAPSARRARTAGPGRATTRSLNASRSPSRARSSRMRSRRWTGSSETVVERRSSTVGGSLRTAIVRPGESSIGPGGDAATAAAGSRGSPDRSGSSGRSSNCRTPRSPSRSRHGREWSLRQSILIGVRIAWLMPSGR